MPLLLCVDAYDDIKETNLKIKKSERKYKVTRNTLICVLLFHPSKLLFRFLLLLFGLP